MLTKKFVKNKLTVCVLSVGLLGSSASVLAKTYTLEQGQSQLIETNKKIDTIFVSSPNIADYEILDDNSFMIYAKAEGKSEVVAFDSDGKPLTSDVVNVNTLINNLSNANSQIKARFPNSNLTVKKVGKAYVIEGKAASQVESDEVTQIVGEALGESKTLVETKFGDESVTFLDKNRYDKIVNSAKVEDTTQINVKLSVVEVTKSFSEAMGINWSNFVIDDGSLNFGKVAVTGAFTGSAGNVGLLSATGVSMFINAMNDQNNAKVLAEPSVSVLSGETANILVGGEIPFAQRDKEGSPSIIYKEYGISLTVGAKLQKNNRIRLILDQSVSNIVGTYQYEGIGSVPYFDTRKSKSTFEVADGESFVIGGLLRKEDAEGIKKVPLLGDVPILGAFFRSATTSRTDKELVIVATVNTVKPVNGSDVVYPSFERTGTMERFFNTTPVKKGAEAVYNKTLTTNFLKNGGFIQ